MPSRSSASGFAGRRSSWGSFARGEEALYAGDGAAGARIAAVARDLEGLAQLDPALAPLTERLRSAQALVEDVAADLSRLAGQVRFEPDRLGQIEERLYLLSRLARKHGGTLATVIERQQALARELEELGSFEEGLESRADRGRGGARRMIACADVLSERRRKAARTLGKKIDETLRDLGLRDATVKVDRRGPGGAGVRGARPGALLASRPTRARRRGRWRASPRAGSCRGSCSRSSARSPRRTGRSPTCSTRSTRASAGGRPR